MAADKPTLEKIKTLHPRVRQDVYNMYMFANDHILGKGVRLRFTYTFRTPEEQHALFLQRPIVTKADAWQSVHNYGLAFDIVLLIDKNLDGVFETATWDTVTDFDKDGQSDWMEIVKFFKSHGWEWGGDWKSFKDRPHFQKTFGLTVKKMKAKIDAKQYSTEIINGTKYRYIDLP